MNNYTIRSYKTNTPQFADEGHVVGVFDRGNALEAWEALKALRTAVARYWGSCMEAPHGLDTYYVLTLVNYEWVEPGTRPYRCNGVSYVKLDELVMPDYSAYWDE